MSDAHRIHQTTFDLGFSSREKNPELQDKISGLFNGRIVEEIGALFSDYDLQGHTIQIKELRLDTGKISYSDLETELPKRILEALQLELEKLRPAYAPVDTPSGYKIIAPADHLATALEYLLETGTFRWQHRQYTAEDLLETLIRSHRSQLIKLLRRIGKKEHVRLRLVYQFSLPKIDSLIQTLEPSYGDFIVAYIRDTDKIQEKQKLIPASAEEFRKARYLFVLTYLLVECGSVFNTRSFLRSQLRQISAHYSMDYYSLLLLFAEALPEQYKGSGKHNLFHFIREILIEDHPMNEADSLPFTEKTKASVISGNSSIPAIKDQYLFYYLEKGYPPASIGFLSQEKLRHLLMDATRNRRTKLMDFIARVSKRKVAANISLLLDKPTAGSFFQIFMPAYSSWINEIHDALLELDLQSLFTPATGKGSMPTILQRSVLYAGLLSAGQIFNKRSFLAAVIKNTEYLSGTNPVSLSAYIRERLEWAGFREYSVLIATDNNTRSERNILETEHSYTIKPAIRNREINALKYFLLHGKSPWWYEAGSVNTFKQLLEAYFYKASRTPLLTFLGRHIREQKFRKHFLQLSDSDDLLAGRFYQHEEQSAATESLWLNLKNKISYTSFRALKEAHIIYRILHRSTKTESLWQEMQKLFRLHRIDLHRLYEELLPVTGAAPGFAPAAFFSFLHIQLAETLVFKYEEQDELTGLYNQENTATEDEAAHKLLIEHLLDYLHTGEVTPAEYSAKMLVLETTKKPILKQNRGAEKFIISSLKNETSVNRLLAVLEEKEQSAIVQQIFRHEADAIKQYLEDLLKLFHQQLIRKKFPVTHTQLIKLTLFFLAEHHRKQVKITDYIRFIMKRLFPDYSFYCLFYTLVKKNVLAGNIRIHAQLAAMLRHIAKEEKENTGPDNDQDAAIMDEQDTIMIDNAGLILLTPFFPFYFQTLGLTENNAFISPGAAARAACLMEYLVSGNEQIKEHTLSLNKALCNIPRHFPVQNPDGITEQEKELSELLLQTAITRWSALQNTSIEGLRNSFLKRKGSLQWAEEISLLVKPTGYDILLDKIPWNISVIRPPWVEKPIYVKWR